MAVFGVPLFLVYFRVCAFSKMLIIIFYRVEKKIPAGIRLHPFFFLNLSVNVIILLLFYMTKQI